MKDSLLVSLRSYRARPGRDAREDFITTAFAWTLQTVPEIGDAFLERLDAEADAGSSSEEIVWDTHVSLDLGIADMVVEQASRTYVFEHKVYSEATAEQVDRYRRSIDTGEVVTVLITASRWNYTSDSSFPDPDVLLTWAEVHELLDQEAESLSDRDRVDDFLALLTHENLDPREQLSESSLRAFVASEHVTDELYALVDAVRAECDWSFAYDHLPALDEVQQPSKRWGSRTRSNGNFQYGRIAFDLYKPWMPGILAGLIVDPGNTQTELVAPERGPDLSVFIGLPRKRLSDQDYRSLVTSDAFQMLCQRVEEEASRKGWTVQVPTGQDPSVNAHHPIVLQQPLADVLRGAGTRDKQRDTVYQTLRSGVDSLVGDDDIQAVRKTLREMVGPQM